MIKMILAAAVAVTMPLSLAAQDRQVRQVGGWHFVTGDDRCILQLTRGDTVFQILKLTGNDQGTVIFSSPATARMTAGQGVTIDMSVDGGPAAPMSAQTVEGNSGTQILLFMNTPGFVAILGRSSRLKAQNGNQTLLDVAFPAESSAAYEAYVSCYRGLPS